MSGWSIDSRNYCCNEYSRFQGSVAKNKVFDRDGVLIGSFSGNQIYDRNGQLVAQWDPPLIRWSNGQVEEMDSNYITDDMRLIAAYLLLELWNIARLV